MASGLEIIIGDDQVKSVFVNVFGGITACDAVANGIVHAFELLASRRACRCPTGGAPGRQCRAGSSDPGRRKHRGLEQVDTMDGAARRAAELAAS